VAVKVEHGRNVRAKFTILCKHGGDPNRSHHAGGACGTKKATGLTNCGWKLSFTTILKKATHTATNTEASFGVWDGIEACYDVLFLYNKPRCMLFCIGGWENAFLFPLK